MNNKTKPMPSLKSDAQAEQFVAKADLSTFDLSGFKPMRFEVEPKSAALHLRLPESLLQGLKNRAKNKGIPYTRYVRMLLESDLAQR
jgi:predicted DNA binding CopG/RHH family protein